MHAIFLTFEFAGENVQLTRAFTEFAERLNDVSELVIRTWMKDGSTVAGFCVFRSTDAAEQFLKGARTQALTTHPLVSDFYVRHFSTLGSIGAALPNSPAALRSSSVAAGEACPIWQADVDQVVVQTA